MTLSRALRNVAFLGATAPKFDFVFTIGDDEDVPGRLGRTRSQHLDAYATHNPPYDVNSNPWLNDTNKYDVVDGIQYFSAPFDGYYRVFATGAQLGRANHTTVLTSIRDVAGMAAGTFLLQKDDLILILCGRNGHFAVSQASPSRYDALGGNGGSYVARGTSPSTSSPLVVAGGSGRVNYFTGGPSVGSNDGLLWAFFNGWFNPLFGGTNVPFGSDGGQRAGAGFGGESRSAAGGAGFFGDSRSYSGNRGGQAFVISEERKAKGFTQGGAGGIGWDDPEVGYGGFGGGGGTRNFSSSFVKNAGGGGGYHGGGAFGTSSDNTSDVATSGRGTLFIDSSAANTFSLNPGGGSNAPKLSDFPPINNFSTPEGLTRSGRVWIRYSPVI